MKDKFVLSIGAHHEFWNTFLKAVETKPIENRTVYGASGLEHSILAQGYDHERKRLVIVSGEPDARTASLARQDIASAHPDIHVDVVRPVVGDLSKVALGLATVMGNGTFTLDKLVEHTTQEQAEFHDDTLDELNDAVQKRPDMATHYINTAVYPWFTAANNVPVNAIAVIQEFIGQLGLVRLDTAAGASGASIPLVILDALINHDPLQDAINHGICGIPLYDVSDDDKEDIFNRGRVDSAKDALKSYGVLQYFFPPADSLALSLIDQGVKTRRGVQDAITLSSKKGHPASTPDILMGGTRLDLLIDELTSKNYILEMDEELVVSESGQEVRRVTRIRPREGWSVQLSRIIKLRINIKGLFNSGVGD